MRTLSLTLLASALLGLAAFAAAETPYLVTDINSLPETSVGSFPEILGVVNGAAFVRATDDTTGQEVWRTDGTDSGTWKVADICPGTCGSDPVPLLATPGGFFFIARDEHQRPQLWVTRGTPASTFQLTTAALSIGRSPRPVWDGRRNLLFFSLGDSSGETLWRSDGTPAGTHRVADVSLVCDFNNPVDLTLFAGKVFFCADDGSSGPALWATDGTARGTRLVKSFGDLSGTGGPRGIRRVGNVLVFPAVLPSGPSGKIGLWRSDGTARGTVPLVGLGIRKEVVISSAVTLGSRLLFTLRTVEEGPSALWVTNGTAGGTRKLASFPTTGLGVHPFTFGNRILFSAADSAHGAELWITDGTPAGTRLFKDFCPGPCSSQATPLLVDRNRLVITARTPGRGSELWTTDGTVAGTRILRDVCRGPCDAFPRVLGVRNGRLVFVARDGAGVDEIWSTDGTAQGTGRVSRFGPQGNVWRDSLYDASAVLPTGFLFVADDPDHGRELWHTEGTPAGTRLVRDLATVNVASSDPQALMRLGAQVFFFADDGTHGFELWKSDGTGAGTGLVAELVPGSQPISPPVSRNSRAAGGKLFFQLDTSPSPSLWRTDGTTAGTLQVTPQDLAVGRQLTAVGSRVFFTAAGQPTSIEYQLWVSDGTVAGTRKVAEMPLRPPEFLTSFQERLYFSVDGQLWSSDGTPQGTEPQPTPEPLSNVSLLTVHGGSLYFFAHSEGQGFGLWRMRTDITADDMVLVVQLAGFSPDGMLSTEDRLFFSGDHLAVPGLWMSDGTTAGTVQISDAFQLAGTTTVFHHGVLYVSLHNGQLWRSDGTAAGTGLVRLEVDGFEVRGPLVTFGDLLYGLTAGALVETDGTPAGTRLIRAASPAWRIPPGTPPVPAGSHLFFSASAEDTGQELWAVASQSPVRDSRNAAISSPLRTSRRSPASTGWFQVLPSIAGNRASSVNWSGVARTSASSPSSDSTSSRSWSGNRTSWPLP